MSIWKLAICLAVLSGLLAYVIKLNMKPAKAKKDRNKLKRLYERFAGANNNNIVKYDIAGLFINKHIPKVAESYIYENSRHPLNPNFHSAIWYLPSYAVSRYEYLQVIKSDQDRFMQHLDRCIVLITSQMNANSNKVSLNTDAYDITDLYGLVDAGLKSRGYPAALFSRVVGIAFHEYSSYAESCVTVNHLEMFDHPSI